MPYNRIYSEEKWKQVNTENKNIIIDFLTELKSTGRKKGTLEQYRYDLRIVMIYVLDNLKNKTITDLSKKDFRRFSLWLTEDCEVSAARANRILSCCRSLLTFLEDDDDYDYSNNVISRMHGLPKEAVRDIVFLKDEVIMRLYEKFKAEKRYKDALLLAFLYESGLRKNEVTQVLKESVTDTANATNVVIGKRGKKFRGLYFNLTKEAAKLYFATRTDTDPHMLVNSDGKGASAENLYAWVVNWRKDLKELTGEDIAINVHSLRHCFINNTLDGTHEICRQFNLGAIPLEKVKILAHHESSDTTLRYAENRDDKEIEEMFGISLG